jgi:hypothetical protein
MHKSLLLYAKALNCTPGHVRRLIRAGHVPSAKLKNARLGRPQWVIEDTSTAAIELLKRRPVRSRNQRPTFWEPFRMDIFEEKDADGRPSLRYEISWRVVYTPECTDDFSTLFEIVQRIALDRHSLTLSDLRHPPLYSPDKIRYFVVPEHERKVADYEQTLYRCLMALRRKGSFARSLMLRLLNVSIRDADLHHAADQLALYHRLYRLDINCYTLAQVLGTSKSTLYRTYRDGVRESVGRARSKTRSATQFDAQKSLDPQFGPSSTDDYSNATLDAACRLCFGEGKDGEEPFGEFNKAINDLPFQILYDVAVELLETGHRPDYSSIARLLRKRGIEYYNAEEFDRAISAAHSSAA